MVDWNPSTYPEDNEEIGQLPLWFRRVQQALEDLINREHEDISGAYGVGDGTYTGGEHSLGSAVCYIGTTAPTNRPDGTTALANNNIDKSRLWLDTNSTPPTLKTWNGSAWVTFESMGAGRIYVGDYSASAKGDALPTKNPDSVTALGSADAGRLAYDTDATYGSCLYLWSGSAWVELGLCSLLHAQTIAGVKTFSSFPVVASVAYPPTTDYQLTPKKYVDAQDTAIIPVYAGGQSWTFGKFTVKMGKTSVVFSGGTGTINFTDAFTGGIVAAVITKTETSGDVYTLTSKSASSLSLAKTGGNATYNVEWIAIGYEV